jgi:hypothetical protein
MKHVVLLGDSIFDNAAYVNGGPDVTAHLEGMLPAGWRVTLAAVDGSVSSDVHRQLADIPEDATHLVVSVGGNDALGHLAILDREVSSSAETLTELSAIAESFEERYGAMLEAVLGKNLPVTLCTVYHPSFPDEVTQRLAVTALSVFNDVILRRAFTLGLPVIDLRLVCDDPGDYANPIEPSVQGGRKIAGTIRRVLAEHDFQRRESVVFVRGKTD